MATGIWERARRRRACCGSRQRSAICWCPATRAPGQRCATGSTACCGVGGVLQLWHPPAGVPGDRQPRLRPGPPLPAGDGVRRARGASPTACPLGPTAMCLAMKPVGKADAGNPQVRFDERGRRDGSGSCRIPRPSSNLPRSRRDRQWLSGPGAGSTVGEFGLAIAGGGGFWPCEGGPRGGRQRRYAGALRRRRGANADRRGGTRSGRGRLKSWQP
jgi:hypothetical protein